MTTKKLLKTVLELRLPFGSLRRVVANPSPKLPAFLVMDENPKPTTRYLEIKKGR